MIEPCLTGPLAGLCGTLLLTSVAVAASPPPQEIPGASLSFELEQADGLGVLPPGEALVLSIIVKGVPAGRDPVVALLEGGWAPRRLVPLTPEARTGWLRASVTLEPYSAALVPGRSTAVRIDVSVARERGMRLDRLLKRSVFVTLGSPQTPGVPAHAAAMAPPRDSIHHDVPPGPDVPPVPEDRIIEEDLLPVPVAAQARTYWREITRFIARNWALGSGADGPVRMTQAPSIRFRLQASGEAQLIQVERSSGVSGGDEAGMQAVVRAHPFPPFPPDLQAGAVEVHVDLRGDRAPRSAPRARSRIDLAVPGHRTLDAVDCGR